MLEEKRLIKKSKAKLIISEKLFFFVKLHLKKKLNVGFISSVNSFLIIINMKINRNLVKWSRTIHIYLSIVLLITLVFFSVTGITLNHVDIFTAEPKINEIRVDNLPDFPLDAAGQIALSSDLSVFLQKEFSVDINQATVTSDGDFLFVDLRKPGATVFIEIDQALGEALGEKTSYGFIAMLNDLHKARDTDALWPWLLDISSILLIIFSLAGLVLLLPNTNRFKRVAAYSTVAIILISIGYWLGTP